MSKIIRSLVALTLLLVMPVVASAGFVSGTQGFADIGNPVLGASDIQTTTLFTFGTVITNASQTGDFVLLAPQTLVVDGPLDLTDPTLFSLTGSAFGVFQASSISEIAGDIHTRAFLVTGLFTGGTAFGPGSVPTYAVAAISFTQVSGPGGAVSGSLTLDAPLPNPEPTTVASACLGAVVLIGYRLRRRR